MPTKNLVPLDNIDLAIFGRIASDDAISRCLVTVDSQRVGPQSGCPSARDLGVATSAPRREPIATAATAAHRCRPIAVDLFVLVILAHQRRGIVHVAVTAHPTAAWTAQQLREAFPEDAAPRYLIHDRDHAFAALAATASGMGIQELRTAPRSPWQNAYVERVIGSIRRECLDHMIVMNETGLSRLLTRYLA